MIFGFLVGDAKGKLCFKEVSGSNVPEGIACIEEADTLQQSGKTENLAKRSIYLKYHLPVSTNPQLMLVSYGLYKLVNPLYHAICQAYIEAPWRELRRLPDILPDFSVQRLQKVDLIVNSEDFEDWGDSLYFNLPVKSYPHLSELTMIHAHEVGTSYLMQFFEHLNSSAYDRGLFPNRCSCHY